MSGEPLDLDALAALEQAATPGPWEVEQGANGVTVGYPLQGGFWERISFDSTGADAALIAATRNALPALIEAARERDALVAAYDGKCGCTELCSMGPTCPGAILSGLDDAGCGRAVIDDGSDLIDCDCPQARFDLHVEGGCSWLPAEPITAPEVHECWKPQRHGLCVCHHFDDCRGMVCDCQRRHLDAARAEAAALHKRLVALDVCERCGLPATWSGDTLPGAPCMGCGRYPAALATGSDA